MPPKDGEVLVKIHAVSLQHRDLLVVNGKYGVGYVVISEDLFLYSINALMSSDNQPLQLYGLCETITTHKSGLRTLFPAPTPQVR